MRSLARECVFKYLFSKLFNPSDEGLFDVLIKDLKDDDKNFARELLAAITEKEDFYLEKISGLAIGYKLNRIHNTDKCILMLGLAELEAFKDTPKPVVIDEAVNLAAKFSTENSTNFVNGVLAEYAKEI